MINPMAIHPNKGHKKGDPLSPYIFIFCMEALSHWLIKEASKKKLRIVVKIYPKYLTILGMLFANDYSCFCKTKI